MDFDTFLNFFAEELLEMWRNSTHYITTDYGRFVEIKYDAFKRKGTF
jgi:hypothetical protein